MDYESVIGLEVHLQLDTESKIFSGARATFGDSPNTNIDPFVFGLPGSLPVLNRQVVECAIMMGLALNCQIRRESCFARKHYFYPDLPKGYQISQYEQPICEHGRVKVRTGESVRAVGITRIHMEEDAGKSIHDSQQGCSFVDLNRAGVPLLEIVSEPDIRSPAEASVYLKTLRQIARYLGISDGNMEEGSLRCDANVSLRPKGDLKFGTRTEIKNLNSFKFVERAIEYELARQLSLLKSDKEVVQETRLFDSAKGTTHSMRSKEESADYRYFPDPDLPPLVVEESWINSVRAAMPKLPQECLEELITNYQLSEYDAGVLTAEKRFYDYFIDVCTYSKSPKNAANWITSELFSKLKQDDIEIDQTKIGAEQLGELIRMIEDEVISGRMAKDVFEEMWVAGAHPQQIVEEKGLRQITDDTVLAHLVQQVLEQYPEQLQQCLDGKEKVLGFFVGQVMKETGGAANPKKVNELIRDEIALRKKS